MEEKERGEQPLEVRGRSDGAGGRAVVADGIDLETLSDRVSARQRLAAQLPDGLPVGVARPLALALQASSRRPFWQLLQERVWVDEAGEAREIVSLSAAELAAAIAECRSRALSLKLSLAIELHAEVQRLRYVDERPEEARRLAGEALGVALAHPDDLLRCLPLMEALRRRLAQVGQVQ